MKYRTRDDKLRDAIENELSRDTPSIDSLMNIVRKYESVNLKTIDKLQKNKKAYSTRINGALKQAINSHGPITKSLLGSATKRIYGALIVHENDKLSKIKKKYYIFGVITCTFIGILVYLFK